MPARFKKLTSGLMVSAVAFIFVAALQAAESVRLVDNLNDYNSQLAISSATMSAVQFTVDAEAVGITPDMEWNSGYQQVDLPDGELLFAGKLTEIGEPELPVLTTMIAIPDLAGVTVTADYESFEVIDDIDVLPAQIPEPEAGFTDPQPFSLSSPVYNRDQFYPEVLAEAGTPVILRDVRLVQITVYPVHFNPVTRQLKVYRNISIDVSFEGEVINPKTTRHNYISEAFYPLYKATIANFDEYMTTITNREVKRGGILIITPDIGGYPWKQNMEAIANWKRQKGYEVVLATTYDVTPNGKPTNTQLKAFIQNAYNSWETPPDFVYLVGDEDLSYSGDIIPDYPYSYYASDHQYGCVDGTDWLPDIAACRVAVDNTNELGAWIAKVMKYEKEPEVLQDREFWRRAIMVAGGQQTETCVWTVKWCKERLEQIGFVQVDTAFDEGIDPPDYTITNPISNGVGYVNYRGWAGSSGWWDPSWQVSQMATINNINKPGIMTSIVCGTGNFGSSTDPCFGELWIRLGSSTAPKGGPCFFGSTDGGTHTQWNNPISFGFYHALINQEIYHFGMAVIAGKLNQYRNYPRALSTIEKYFHTYNMLGDPELEMRLKTPIDLSVTYPATVERGVNSIEINVIGDGLRPVKDAYATLIMGEGTSESFFYVTKTDAMGNAILDLPTDTTGQLLLTITGRDLHPFIVYVNIVQEDETIGPDIYTIDDDMIGYSHGNADGLISPAEVIELSVDLTNFGSTAPADNVTARLVSIDENIAIVHHESAGYGLIQPGQTASSADRFVFTVQPSAIDGEIISFRLIVTSDANPQGWTSIIHIPVSAARFSVTDVDISGNGMLDPDETAQLTIELTNAGTQDVSGVTGVLSTVDGYVHVETGSIDFGNIPMSGSGDGTPISVTVDPGTFKGKNVPFILNLESADGAEYQTAFNLTVGNITSTDPCGPDAYGYYMFDNTDISHSEAPSYNWMEIYNSGGQNHYLADDSRVIVNLPFDLVYYGERHNRITICSNGWICPDSSQWVGFRNWILPDPSYCQAMIAGFWDDLGPSGSNNVYTFYDETNHRYVIEWYHVTPRDYTHQQTFQIVIYDPAYTQTITGDAVIEFIYNDILNGDVSSSENYASIGWEDMTELIGFSISYSNSFAPGAATLSDGRVYRITTNNGRGGISGLVQANGGDASDVKIKASTGQWLVTRAAGLYTLKDIPPGTPDLTFSKDGWFPQTISHVYVTANTVAQNQNATLEMCPIPQDFAASEGLGDHVHLTWIGVNHPDIAGYDIYRNRFEDGIFTRLNDTPVVGNAYDDYTTIGDEIYWYYVVAVYEGADYGAVSLGSDKAAGSNANVTGIEDIENVPDRFALAQNYPNPFNAQTIIQYSLPVAGQVSLGIYNILGQKILTLFDDYQQAGYKSIIWNGTDSNGRNVASGIYFYRLSAGDQNITRKMLMVK